MPTGMPELAFAVPTFFKLDGAWAHKARHATDFVTDKWRSVLVRGRPHYPIARRIVEMVFRRIADWEHQFPNTTGAHIHDPRRQRDRKGIPAVPIEHIPAIFSVAIADYNATIRSDLFNHSPIEVVKNAVRNGLLIRRLPDQYRKDGFAFIVRKRLQIKGDGRRSRAGAPPNRVHVNYCYEPYFNDEVLFAALAAGVKEITVEYDRRDIRNLTVISKGGDDIGRLRMQGPWAAFPHTEKLRAEGKNSAKTAKENRDDPLAQYWSELRNRNVNSKAALKLFDLIRQIAPPVATPSLVGTAIVVPEAAANESISPRPIWTPRTFTR